MVVGRPPMKTADSRGKQRGRGSAKTGVGVGWGGGVGVGWELRQVGEQRGWLRGGAKVLFGKK